MECSEFEPDAQFDNQNATDINLQHDNNGGDDIVIPNNRPYIMMMFETDKENEVVG